MPDEPQEERTVELPDKDNRTDEATVALPVQAADSTSETVTADETRAKIPETPTVPAGNSAAGDGVPSQLPSLPETAEKGQAATTPPEPAATAGPEIARTAADATIPLPAAPSPEEPTTALLSSSQTREPNSSVARSAAPEVTSAPVDAPVAVQVASTGVTDGAAAPADATVAIPPAPPCGADDSSPQADQSVAIPPASMSADRTAALPP